MRFSRLSSLEETGKKMGLMTLETEEAAELPKLTPRQRKPLIE
jgi:hypothetical protein